MRRASFALVVLLASCGTASAPTTPDPAAGPPEAKRCGEAPFVHVTGVVREFSGLSADPKSNVRGTFSTCAGKRFTSAAGGLFEVFVAKAAPFFVKFEHVDLLTLLSPELALDADFTNDFQIPSRSFGPLIPGFGADKTAIIVGITSRSGATGVCAAGDKVALSVAGHPEAIVTYFGGSGVPQPVAGATETTKTGLATITGLADGTLLTVTANKAGCTATGKYGSFTGRVKVENGAAAGAGIELSNP